MNVCGATGDEGGVVTAYQNRSPEPCESSSHWRGAAGRVAGPVVGWAWAADKVASQSSAGTTSSAPARCRVVILALRRTRWLLITDNPRQGGAPARHRSGGAGSYPRAEDLSS